MNTPSYPYKMSKNVSPSKSSDEERPRIIIHSDTNFKKAHLLRIPEKEEAKTLNLIKSARVSKSLSKSFNVSCDKYKTGLTMLAQLLKKAQLRGLDFKTAHQDINEKSLSYLSKVLSKIKNLNQESKLILELGHCNLQFEINPHIKE
jgi:hypothetical protein